MPQSVQPRNALWAIRDRLDPDEAKRERFSDVPRLLETLRVYGSSSRINRLANNLTSETVAELNSWLSELGLAAVDELPPPPEPPMVPEPYSITTEPSPSLPPLPLTWPEFVLGVRERLQSGNGSLPPFSRWTLPQHRWSSRWVDAYAVIAADEQDLNSGFVLIPSDDAATAAEVQDCIAHWLRQPTGLILP